MHLGDYLCSASARLKKSGIESARLDCLLLLEDRLGHDRAWILAHPEHELTDNDIKVLDDLVARRALHVPLAQLRGHSEFYGRTFIVTADVLQPRPESEAIIEVLKKFVLNAAGCSDPQSCTHKNTHGVCIFVSGEKLLSSETKHSNALQIADIGTGTGALGITAQLELPNAAVDLIEIDDAAIEIAKRNVIKHTTGQQVIKSDLLAQTDGAYDILLCNLPYVPDDYEINEGAKHEPKIALFAGEDGLDAYRALFKQIAGKQKRPLLILTESLPEQSAPLQLLGNEYGYAGAAITSFVCAFVDRSVLQ